MSDSNSNRKTTARQDNASSSGPDYFGSMRANLKMSGHHANQGFVKSANHYTNSISTTGPAQGTIGTTGQIGVSVVAGGKEWGQAAKYGTRAAGDWSKGALNGFISYVNQGSNPIANYNNMKMYQAMDPQGRNPQQNKVSDARTKATQVKQNSGYKLKANQMNQPKTNQPSVNKGIEAARQKATANKSEAASTQSTNQGIASYQSKASEKSAGSSKGSVSSTVKGSSASGDKSGGSSSSGQSR